MEKGDTLTRRRGYAKINVKKEMLADKRLAQWYLQNSRKQIGALRCGYFCVCCHTMINTIKSNNVTFTWDISICNTPFLGA